MKRHLLILLPLLSLIFSSCGTSKDSSSSFSSESSSEIESSETSSSIDSSSSKEKKWEKHVSALNPINEPLIAKQYYLNHIGDIYNTWRDLQGNGQTIAVIDVGFMANHPDFTYEDGSSKVSNKSASFRVDGSSVTVQEGINNLGVTSIDTTHDAWYNNSHGTFCAGVAAAGINGKGVIGIAPLAELMLLKTDGHPLSIVEALKYAADNGARTISISIGSYANYDGDLVWAKSSGINLVTAFNDAVTYCKEKGTVVISAAGNGGNTTPTYPGNSEGVIGVGGLEANKTDKKWDRSSYNPDNVKTFCEVFAPSDGMFGCCDYDNKYDGGLNPDGSQKWVGTSFSAPIVAGLAALYFERFPNKSVDDFYNDLTTKSRSFAPTQNTGYGRIDIGNIFNSTSSTKITAKIKNSGDIYMYEWNSVSGLNNTWPGKYVGTGNNVTHTISLDGDKYDSVLFHTGGSDSERFQTVDLSISSFSFGNTYNADEVTNFSERVVIGTFIKN